jgi:hypothetical protein
MRRETHLSYHCAEFAIQETPGGARGSIPVRIAPPAGGPRPEARCEALSTGYNKPQYPG